MMETNKMVGWITLPVRIVHDKELSPMDVRVLSAMMAYDWSERVVEGGVAGYRQKSEVFPSQKTLAEDIGVCERTIRTAFANLKKRGFIKLKRRRFNNSSIYILDYDKIFEGSKRPKTSRTKVAQEPVKSVSVYSGSPLPL